MFGSVCVKIETGLIYSQWSQICPPVKVYFKIYPVSSNGSRSTLWICLNRVWPFVPCYHVRVTIFFSWRKIIVWHNHGESYLKIIWKVILFGKKTNKNKNNLFERDWSHRPISNRGGRANGVKLYWLHGANALFNTDNMRTNPDIKSSALN